MKVEVLDRRVLTADDSLFLTNGETFATVVVLGKEANIDEWWEITAKEKEWIEQAVSEDTEATEADYQDALRKMGVSL